jgi:alkylated DNA repair dioxygenase AlkB
MSTAQLDLLSPPPAAAPAVAGLVYRPAFLDATRETALLTAVDARPWLADLKRRVQHYGYKYDYKARAIATSMFVGPLPDFAVELAGQLVQEGLLLDAPDQLIVNEYAPGQGISAHIDCEPCFKERIVTVSLGSAAEMEFRSQDEARPRVHLLLEPRSALLISGEARYHWTHAIRGRKSDHGRPRTRRVSLTFRNVILAGNPLREF